MVEVKSIATGSHTGVGALIEVESGPACGALVTAAAHAGFTQR